MNQEAQQENEDLIHEKSSQAKKEQEEHVLVRWLRLRGKKARIFFLFLMLVVLLALTLGLGYLCLYMYLPIVWDWGFNPASWKGILSVFGAIYLVIIPFIPIGYSAGIIKGILNIFIEEEESPLKNKLLSIERSQAEIENTLEKNEKGGLIPLVKYSRLQLEAYYKIGLSQTQRSFRYSIIAMWIGFLIIIAGIVLYILPVEKVNEKLVESNLQVMTIIGGTVVEFISALFLWVYRNSINQLTYFYNRQIFIHHVLLCAKISDGMKEPDVSKRYIIEKVLDYESKVPTSRLPKSRVGKLLQKKE
ncbi:MAG: hypothetical protein HY033_12980 [Ignavibacteriae bacterium]|nr:hypothetical protein [Ignavibacteria bacterium]MBI3365807.1 hypothetical protein [Ignavibacteriota bacterium]